MASAAAHYRFEKSARKKAIAVLLKAPVALFLAATLLPAKPARPVDALEQLQEKFDKENDGVRKAKLMLKLGEAQFVKERDATRSGDFVTAGVVMEKYRDNVRAALQALKKSHPDAEKHPNGYKQLESETAEGLREIRDVMLAMPEPLRPPMQAVDDDLREMNMELLKLLFPRRPGEKPSVAPAASNPKKDQTPEKQP